MVVKEVAARKPAARLPEGWHVVRFGDVVRNVDVAERKPLENGLERYIGLDHLDPGSLHIKRWGLIEEGTSFTRKFVKGQVLFGKRRAYQRKAAVAEFDGICSGDILVFEPQGDDLIPELLPFIVQSDKFFEHALSTSAGSLSPRTKWKDLASYEFALPPKVEQHRIAEILWAADATVQAYEGLLEQLYTIKQSVSLRLMSRGIGHEQFKKSELGEIPKAWFVRNLGYFLSPEDIRNGLYKPADSYGKGTLIIRIDSYQNGESVNLQALKRVQVSKDELTAFQVSYGDVLVNRVNSLSHLGKTAVVPCLNEPTVFESNMMCLRFRPNVGLIPEYALLLLSSPAAKRQVLARAKKAVAQSSINQGDVRSFKFPIPEPEEQKQIINIVRQIQRNIDSELEHLSLLHTLKRQLVQQLSKSLINLSK